MEEFTLDSVLECGCRYDGLTVEEAMKKYRGIIMQLIKKGYRFDASVLEKAHISRVIREHHAHYELERGKAVYKQLAKDTKKKEDIIKELEVLANPKGVDEDDDNDKNNRDNIEQTDY